MDPRKVAETIKNEGKLKIKTATPGLRIVTPYYYGLKMQPPDIHQATPEGVVFFNLQLCYLKARNVSEGILKDVVWGFRQSGIPTNVAIDGFKKLKDLGYLIWTDKNGVQILGDIQERHWYKWTRKYRALLSDKEINPIQMEDKIKPEDNAWDRIC